MKKILFTLLLFTGFLQAQTYPVNPTKFGKISLNTNVVSTSTNKINTQEADGQINYIDAANLPAPTTVTNALELKTTVSAGAVSGFELTNNGNGTVNIASGIAYLRLTNDPYSSIVKYPISAVTNLALTDNANNYVLVDYNGGSPALTVTTNASTINTQTNSLAYVISRVGNTLDYLNLVGQNIDPNAKLRVRFLNQEGIRRASGAILGFSNRNLTLTSSTLFSGLIRLDAPAFNTLTPDTFTLAYNNGATWTRTTAQTQVNNTQYNASGTLTALGNNDYRTDYVYLLPNNPSKLYLIMGTVSYTSLTLAQAAPRPSSLPTELQVLGLEVGRLFIQKNNASINSVQSSFSNDFVGASVPEHNSLSGLQGGAAGEYNHLTNAQIALVNGSEQITNKQNSLAVDGTGTKYATVDGINSGMSTKQELVDLTTISGWGDSLTAGTGSTLAIYNYLGYLSSLTGYSVFNGGVGGETSTQIKARMLAAPDRFNNAVIIWAGNNNYYEPSTVMSDIAAMVASIGHNRYLILGVINGDYPDRYIGESGYNSIVSLNNSLSTLYGSHFIDIRTYLVSLYNPSIPQDVIDHSNDIIPSSIRTDQIHLTDAGYLKVAEKIKLSIDILEGNSKITDARYLANLFSKPPFIGAVTKNRGAFTYLSASKDLNVDENLYTNGAGRFYNTLYANLQTNNLSALSVGGGLVSGWTFTNGTSRNVLKGYYNGVQTTQFDPQGFSYINSGNLAIGTVADNTNKLRVNGTGYFDGALTVADTSISGIPFKIGGGTNSGWVLQNAGSPTSRVRFEGYISSTRTINLDPNGSSFLNGLTINTGAFVSNGESSFNAKANFASTIQDAIMLTVGATPTTNGWVFQNTGVANRVNFTGYNSGVLSVSLRPEGFSYWNTGANYAIGSTTDNNQGLLQVSGNITASPATLGNQVVVKSQLDAITVPDATTTVKGKIKLAGDLGGTADLPTVPSLSLKANLASPTFTGTVSGITKAMVGLGSVDNTSDVNKPVSTATQTALDLKANLASPTFTGTPTVPTATAGTNTTQIATMESVQTAITNNGIITTATNITNTTLTDTSLPQNGKTLYISNGSSNVNYTINGSITASFVKGGTGSITFVQGSGRTIVAANGTLVFNGAQYSTASVISFGTNDIVYINNF